MTGIHPAAGGHGSDSAFWNIGQIAAGKHSGKTKNLKEALRQATTATQVEQALDKWEAQVINGWQGAQYSMCGREWMFASLGAAEGSDHPVAPLYGSCVSGEEGKPNWDVTGE